MSIVVAVSENGVIGRGGELPWRLPADLARFKRLTMGHALVMGRKTYESIGRPLPGRVSVVLTRDASWSAGHAEVLVATDMPSAISLATKAESVVQDEVYVIGGGEIYRLALEVTERIHLTRIHAPIEGDATFPELNHLEWRLIEAIDLEADDQNEHSVSFETWERIGN